MVNEGKIYFRVSGINFNPEDFVKELPNLSADDIKVRANQRLSTINYCTDEVKSETVDIYSLATSVVGKLMPHINHLKSAKKKFNVDFTLQVVLWISSDDSISMPALGLNSDVIKFLGSIEADFDIDSYRQTS